MLGGRGTPPPPSSSNSLALAHRATGRLSGRLPQPAHRLNLRLRSTAHGLGRPKPPSVSPLVFRQAFFAVLLTRAGAYLLCGGAQVWLALEEAAGAAALHAALHPVRHFPTERRCSYRNALCSTEKRSWR